MIEFVTTFFFFHPYPQGHPIFLWFFFYCGYFLVVKYNFIFPGSSCISISGAYRRSLNVVQAHFYVPCAVLAQNNQGGQLDIWVVFSRACAMKRTAPLQLLHITLSCQLHIQEQ